MPTNHYHDILIGAKVLFAYVYFTEIVTFAVLPLKVSTVMTAVPFFSALTVPFLSTLATLGLPQ
jgi:hypothetical protein